MAGMVSYNGPGTFLAQPRRDEKGTGLVGYSGGPRGAVTSVRSPPAHGEATVPTQMTLASSGVEWVVVAWGWSTLHMQRCGSSGTWQATFENTFSQSR